MPTPPNPTDKIDNIDTFPILPVKTAPGIPTPAYAKPGDAGFDLTLNLETPITLKPDDTARLSCGISMAIPQGHFGMVVPRSSLSKRGLIMANTVGIIDSGYRGDIIAVLRNVGTADETLNPGDRLLQMVIVPFTHVHIQPVEELDATDRGTGAFGSTGGTGL